MSTDHSTIKDEALNAAHREIEALQGRIEELEDGHIEPLHIIAAPGEILVAIVIENTAFIITEGPVSLPSHRWGALAEALLEDALTKVRDALNPPIRTLSGELP